MKLDYDETTSAYDRLVESYWYAVENYNGMNDPLYAFQCSCGYTPGPIETAPDYHANIADDSTVSDLERYITGYAHLIPAWAEMDSCGNITIIELSGDEIAFLQDSFTDTAHFTEELSDYQREELDNGRNVFVYLHDEQVAAFKGEAY